MAFTLQLLHAGDQEAGAPAIEDAPRFSAVLNALKNEDADGDGNLDFPNTLVLSSGDAYIPSPFFFASESAFGAQGRADILIQNLLGFQAIALGNHEFDLGTGVLASLIAPDEEDGYVGAQFPYLSANLDFSTDTALAPLVADDGQEASDIPNSVAGNTIITVNGERIGIVGATTPTLSTISSPGGVTVNPQPFDSTNPDDIAALAAEIQTSVDTLLTNNPDINKVILLAHMQQIAIEQELATLLTDVDVVVAGGSNTLLADEGDRLRTGDEAQGPYPILSTAADGNPVAVINTDGNYTYVGRLIVEFDENGVIIPDSIDPNISGAFATDDDGVAAVGGTPDPEIVAITDALRAVIVDLDGNLFGRTDVFLNGARDDVRTQETNLGNLTADANLFYAKTVDEDVVISIKNGGGIRDNIGVLTFPAGSTNPDDVQLLPPQANEVAGKEEGDISQLDIFNALRFNNGLTLLTVTAEELVALVEHGVAATEPGATPGQFPQVGGFSFSFDATLEPGSRVQSLAIIDEDDNILDVVVENGAIVGDPERTFRTVTLNFLADGGDGYPFPDRDRVDLLTEDLTSPDPDSRTGFALFAPDGTEQDALAEFLVTDFSDTPFDAEDMAPEFDLRIQNLEFREDTVLGDGTEPIDPIDPVDPSELTLRVFDGVTSVFLDLPLLELAAGLVLVSADSTVEPFSDEFQVGFGITNASDFTFTVPPFTPVGGTIEHTGTVTFSLVGAPQIAVTVGNFSIGFDADRVTDIASGFFVEDTIEGNGLDVLFDIGTPDTLSADDTVLTISEADLLLAAEFATALGLSELAGAEVGAARVDADLIEVQDAPQITRLDFEGAEIDAGVFVTDQFADLGVTISAPTSPFEAMIFDTSNPTGGDFDLATDNQGSVLIISENGNQLDPDDQAGGGTLRFEFDDLVGIASVGLLDIDEDGGSITFFDADDSLVQVVSIPGMGDNSQQTLFVNAAEVARMDVNLIGSGAVTTVDFFQQSPMGAIAPSPDFALAT
ncbi:MAG: bifunctional metallophosphatase/5'-nucleotidase [Kaiparowitsia implicata GSE-PSE-MK54-09C]|jgi:2',3'-cyclic-nucleotide 2'-phosphodiesterase (5'-nucleotidase family)|nr:bifunctional metallophosphatase/5'-nucleotidase [Kaiparowitsia implicata GSE-PSE-MK54-09C]